MRELQLSQPSQLQHQQLSSDLVPIAFGSLSGWHQDDHLAAFNCFVLSAHKMRAKSYSTKSMGISANELARIGELAINNPAKTIDQARIFFEKNFQPHKNINCEQSGFLTGYFEPELPASYEQTKKYKYPLYQRPIDLIDIDDTNRPKDFDQSFAFGRKTPTGIVKYYDRRQIDQGALKHHNLEIAWLANPVDVFFIHIQGSARLVFDDGSNLRLSFAAKTGHSYTSIGKILSWRGNMKLEDVTMGSIYQWIKDNPEKQHALLHCNRSFIFFQIVDHPQPQLGPVAAASVALTPARSLAVDRHFHTFGSPFWVQTRQEIKTTQFSLPRLLIAQDTGSAIIGAERGDLFVGTGKPAGCLAGRIKHPISMTVFVPRSDMDQKHD